MSGSVTKQGNGEGDSAPADIDAASVTISPDVGGKGFDPLSDLLVAQPEKPAHLKDINLRTLTAYQRALLTIDGTVTKFIEAYVMEPIMVKLIEQDMLETEVRNVPRRQRSMRVVFDTTWQRMGEAEQEVMAQLSNVET